MSKPMALLIALSALAGCSANAEVDAHYQRCMSLKPGVTLADLRRQFGAEQSRAAGLVVFVPHPDYPLLTSGEIIAHLSDTSEIVRLECGEHKDAF